MPLTFEYLSKLQRETQHNPSTASSHVFHFEKYHSVATTPFRNQISMFSGLYSHNRDFSDPDGYKHWLEDGGDVQRAEWLYSRYRKSGYVTLFTEEHCILSQSIRHLFSSTTPQIDNRFTDLYCQFASDPFQGYIPSNSRRQSYVPYHPIENTDWFIDKLERSSDGWKSGSSCLGNKFIHSILFEYLDQFTSSYNVPYFAPIILMEAFESTRIRIKSLDNSFVHFLQHLEEKGTFSDTMIIITSEQGMMNPSTYNDISNIGGNDDIENQYPLLYILSPPVLSVHYPQVFDALNTNQLELVTTLDLYATLRRIPNFPIPTDNDGEWDITFSNSYEYKEKDKFIPYHSISLLDEIIESHRSCYSAEIPSEMCRCNRTIIPHRMVLPLILFLGFSVIILVWWFWTWCCR